MHMPIWSLYYIIMTGICNSSVGLGRQKHQAPVKVSSSLCLSANLLPVAPWRNLGFPVIKLTIKYKEWKTNFWTWMKESMQPLAWSLALITILISCIICRPLLHNGLNGKTRSMDYTLCTYGHFWFIWYDDGILQVVFSEWLIYIYIYIYGEIRG